MKNYNKGFAQAWILATLVGFVVVAGAAYLIGKNSISGSGELGSDTYDQLDRSDRNLPSINNNTQKTTDPIQAQPDQRVLVPSLDTRVPLSTTLPAPYISGQEGWPPVVQNSKSPYSCVPSTRIGTSGLSEKTEQKIINGKTYCVKSSSEGAAGSSYYTYTYITAYQDGTKTTNFTLRYLQCGGYDEPQQTACERAQTTFNLDAIVDSIMR